MTKDKLDQIAIDLQKFITKSVKNSMWSRSYENEEPTKENIRNSIPWHLVGIVSEKDVDHVMDLVYPKLRKNGILAKLRG